MRGDKGMVVSRECAGRGVCRDEYEVCQGEWGGGGGGGVIAFDTCLPVYE